jgi:hypothetical protein
VVDDDVEVHRSEITRANRTTPIVVGIVALVAIVALFLTGDRDGGDEAVPTPTTTTTSATPSVGGSIAPPPATPTIMGVATTGGDTFLFGVAASPVVPLRPTGIIGSVSVAVTTGRHLALGDTDGNLVARREGDFSFVSCCHRAVLPSYRPGHVWTVDGADGPEEAVLVDLDLGPTDQRIPLEGQAVLGPGPGGLVTRDAEGRAIWRRPRGGALPVPTGEGRQAASSGGDVVAFVAEERADIEVRRVVDGILVRAFHLDVPLAPDVTARLSTSGDTIAIVQGGAAFVFDIATGTAIGRIPSSGTLVPVGGKRFATVVDGAVVDSTGRRLHLPAEARVVATYAE